MHIVNQTFIIDESIVDQWLQWLKTEYIPESLNSGIYSGYKILRIFTESSQPGLSYALQFNLKPEFTFQYLEEHIFPVQNYDIQILFGEKVLFFRTLLEEIV